MAGILPLPLNGDTKMGDWAIPTNAELCKAQPFDKDTYLTPEWVLSPIYDFYGQIGLDPCSNEHSLVKSVEKFTKADDGLTKPWYPYDKVFANCPYSKPNLLTWSSKCVLEAQEGCEILLLVPNYSSASWMQNNVFSTATAILFYNKRISFIRPDGGKSDSPTFHSVLVYWGRRPAEFKETFGHQGFVVTL